jgi:hypothetical protein
MMRGVRWHRRKKFLRLKEQMESKRKITLGISPDDPNDNPILF